MKTFEHVVRTYNPSGKIMWERSFQTADEAYKEYVEVIEYTKRTIPSGYSITVTRYNGDALMTLEVIEG